MCRFHTIGLQNLVYGRVVEHFFELFRNDFPAQMKPTGSVTGVFAPPQARPTDRRAAVTDGEAGGSDGGGQHAQA